MRLRLPPCAQSILWTTLLGLEAGCAQSADPPPAPSVDAASLPAEIQPVFAPDLEPVGFWAMTWDPRWSRQVLQVDRDVTGELHVCFDSESDKGVGHQDRVARLENGAIALRDGVVTDEPRRVLSLFPCRIGGEDVLVPDTALDRVTNGELFAGHEHAFRRFEVDDATTFRALWLEREKRSLEWWADQERHSK